MLAQKYRVTTAADYRSVVRRGARYSTTHSVTYVRRNDDGLRFGFIVSKQVGIAVVRNRVRRRLKAAAYELAPLAVGGADVVIRALPAAAGADYAQLRLELHSSMAKANLLTVRSTETS